MGNDGRVNGDGDVAIEDIERRLADVEERVRSIDASDGSESGDSAERATRATASRRGVMGATGALGLTGLLGVSSRRGAASSPGSVGSEATPVDVFARELEADVADVGQVRTDDLSPNRVRDSTGRYLGELTGSNDATTVIDAIADRRSGAGLVLPDPGFDLAWDRQVDLPLESGFTLETAGRPTIVPDADFAGECAFFKPEGDVERHYVDSVYVDDEHGVLSWAFYLNDFHHSTLFRPYIYNAPGIRLEAEDNWANINVLVAPNVKIPGDWHDDRNGGVGIKLGGAKSNTTDQNAVFFPNYNASMDFTAEDVAYVDEGKHNNWIHSRVEFCHTAHYQDGGKNYFVSIGNWDRSHHMEFTVREVGDAHGHVVGAYGHHDFKRARLVNPNTSFEGVSDEVTGASSDAGPTWVDVFDPVKRATGARTLASMGLRDASSGGSVGLGPTWFQHPFLECSTGTDPGNTAVLDLGDRALTANSQPKVAYPFSPASVGSDDVNVIVRHGFFAGDDDRVEVVFDPTNALGNHDAANWYFEVENGGTIQDRIDTGVAPGEPQEFAVAREESRDGTDRWFLAIDRTHEFAIPEGGGDLGQATWRWYVETTAAADKTWRLRSKEGKRFLRM